MGMFETFRNTNSNSSSTICNGITSKNCALIAGPTIVALEEREAMQPPLPPSSSLQGSKEGDAPSPSVSNDHDDNEATDCTASSTSVQPSANAEPLDTLETTTSTSTTNSVIPSTSMDHRKIFVGGLPTDGKRSILGIHHEMHCYLSNLPNSILFSSVDHYSNTGRISTML